MTNDKKHAANSGCMPDGGPCEICDEPAPTQELDLDALERRYRGMTQDMGFVQDCLALIARVREVEKDNYRLALTERKRTGQLLGEQSRGIRERARLKDKLRAAEQLLRECPKVIQNLPYHAWYERVAEFLKPNEGGS